MGWGVSQLGKDHMGYDTQKMEHQTLKNNSNKDWFVFQECFAVTIVLCDYY